MAAPTFHELQILKEFRNRIKDLNLKEDINSDVELLRWIRVCDHNLDQAEIMLRKHMNWREEVNFEGIKLWDVPKEYRDLLPEKIIGFDKENSPVVLTSFGKWDLKRVVQEMGQEFALKCKWKTFNSVKESMRSRRTLDGLPVTQGCFINDLDGLSILQGTIPVFRTMSEYGRQLEGNFPEIVKCIVVINAPFFFDLFFKCIKPFLNEKTRSKVHIYGKNKEEWIGFLKDIISHDVLPTMYGGSNDITLL